MSHALADSAQCRWVVPQNQVLPPSSHEAVLYRHLVQASASQRPDFGEGPRVSTAERVSKEAAGITQPETDGQRSCPLTGITTRSM